MVAPASGGVGVMGWKERRLMRAVTALALCAALGLAACGRKGELERPPSAAAAGDAVTAPAPPDAGPPPTWSDPAQGNQSSTPPRRRTFVLDPLLN